MSVILVVEDDETVRLVLRTVLVRAGHIVRELPDGRGVVDALKKERIDLMITDLLLPEKEGLETITATRRIFPTLPIVAISGAPHSKVFLRAAQHLGAGAVLSKPFTSAELLSVVNRALEERSAGSW